MKSYLARFFLCCAATAIGFVGAARAGEDDVPLDRLPKAVTQAVMKLLPSAEIQKASKEIENGKLEYEVTVKVKDQRIDIAAKADGTIDEVERQVEVKHLPKAVREALKQKFPGATHQSAESVSEVEDGKEEFKCYEVHLKTSDGKDVEVQLKANGKIVTGDKEGNEQNKENEKEEVKK